MAFQIELQMISDRLVYQDIISFNASYSLLLMIKTVIQVMLPPNNE